jgi:hypothetical protein
MLGSRQCIEMQPKLLQSGFSFSPQKDSQVKKQSIKELTNLIAAAAVMRI